MEFNFCPEKKLKTVRNQNTHVQAKKNLSEKLDYFSKEKVPNDKKYL